MVNVFFKMLQFLLNNSAKDGKYALSESSLDNTFSSTCGEKHILMPSLKNGKNKKILVENLILLCMVHS